jgi:hypothetical protein
MATPGNDGWVDDEGWVDDGGWVDEPATPAPAPAPQAAGPVDYSQYMPAPQETTWTPQQMDAIAPTTPPTQGPMSVAPRFVTNEERLAALTTGLPGGADYRTGPDGKGPVGLGEQAEAAMGIVGSLQQEYIAPPLRAAQKFMREGGSPISGIPGAVERAVGAVAGPDVATAERALTEGILSLPLGPPSEYLTTPEQMRRAKAVADLPPNLGMGDRPVLSGALQSGGEAFAYLPLYLIDAPKSAAKLGIAARGAIAGFFAELADPRREANALRGAVGGAVLGKGLELGFRGGAAAMSRVAREVEAIRTWKIDGLPFGEWAAKQGTVAVVPSTEVKALLDAAPVGDIRAGAKASFMEARRGPHGGIDMRPVQVTPEGKKVGPEAKVDPNATPVQRRSRTPVVAESPEVAAELEALGAPVVRPGKAREMILNPADEGDVLLKEGGSYRTAFDEDGTLRLDALPEGDFLVGRMSETGPVEFRPVKLRNLQIESLRRRDLVVVDTPEGPRFGWDRTLREALPDGTRTNPDERLVVPINPAEKIPNSLTAPIVVGPKQYRLVTSTTEFNDILARRDDLLEAERRAALDAADAAVAVQAQAAGVPVVETPVGPKVAINGTMGGPPPQPPPPGVTPSTASAAPTPVMVGGNGNALPPGAPPTPAPPMPGGNPTGGVIAAVKRAGFGLLDAFIGPTMRGKRGVLTQRQALYAADSAARFKAADVVKNRQGDLIVATWNDHAKWLKSIADKNGGGQQGFAIAKKKLDEARVDLDAALRTGSQDLSGWRQKHPEAAFEMDNFVADWQKGSQEAQAELRRLGWLDEPDIPAPKGLENFTNGLIDDRAYYAQLYLAQMGGPGELSKLVKAKTAEYKSIVDDALQDLELSGPKDWRALSPDEKLARATEAVDRFLGDPDAINKTIVGGAKKSAAGKDALKGKRAGQLPIYAETFNEWAKGQRPAVVDAANRYLRKDITEQQFEAFLKKAGANLAPEDAKFLRAMQEELSESLRPWQLRALRPVMDPLTLMSASASRQQSLLMRARALETLREGGLLKTRAQLEQTMPSFQDEGWKQLPESEELYGKYSKRVGPLETDQFGNLMSREEEWFVHPDAYKSATEFDESLRGFKNLVASLSQHGIYKAYNVKKLGETMANPATWGLQVFANMTNIALKSGVSPLALLKSGQYTQAWRQWQAYRAAPYKAGAPGALTDADWIRRGIEVGTVGSDQFGAELKPMADAMIKASLESRTFDGLGGGFLGFLKKGARFTQEMYAGIDSIAKHGTWLTLMKDAGMDFKTGAVTDLAKADAFINGSRLRQAAFGTRIDLSGLSPQQIGDLVQKEAAWRVNRSFAMPDRPAVVGEAAGLVSTAGVGMVSNAYARIGMEEARTWAMLPYRMASEPGVGAATLAWGTVLLGMGAALQARRRAQGLTDEQVDKSFKALPTNLTAYRPATLGMFEFGDKGEVMYLNTERLFEPLRWAAKDYLARPLEEQAMGDSRGQLLARMAYNASVGTLTGTLAEPAADNLARSAGLQLYERSVKPEQPSWTNVPKALYEWMSPPVLDAALRSYQLANRPQNPVPYSQSLMPLMSAGAFSVGGNPANQASRMDFLDRQEQKNPSRR